MNVFASNATNAVIVGTLVRI